jgi:hypothetical protein
MDKPLDGIGRLLAAALRELGLEPYSLNTILMYC